MRHNRTVKPVAPIARATSTRRQNVRAAAREAAGLSCAQLAKKLGRKESTIRRYEREGMVPPALAQAWAFHTGIHPHLLY